MLELNITINASPEKGLILTGIRIDKININVEDGWKAISFFLIALDLCTLGTLAMSRIVDGTKKQNHSYTLRFFLFSLYFMRLIIKWFQPYLFFRLSCWPLSPQHALVVWGLAGAFMVPRWCKEICANNSFICNNEKKYKINMQIMELHNMKTI